VEVGLKEGLDYIKGTPMILASIIAAYVISIFVGNYSRFLTVFAKDVLQVGPEGLGLLVAAPGVGAVASLIVLGALEERWNRTTRCYGFPPKRRRSCSCSFAGRAAFGCPYYCSDCSAACRLFFARSAGW
jgi:hypothetical protein